MKIIKNNFIPFKKFNAINLFGVVFYREGPEITATTIRHEQIHTAQMKEMLYIFFYLWYVVEWFVRYVIERDAHKAYRSISFEREAYDNQDNLTYFKGRKRFAWVNEINNSLN